MNNKDVVKGALPKENETEAEKIQRICYLVQETFAKEFYELTKNIKPKRRKSAFEDVVLQKVESILEPSYKDKWAVKVVLGEEGFNITAQEKKEFAYNDSVIANETIYRHDDARIIMGRNRPGRGPWRAEYNNVLADTVRRNIERTAEIREDRIREELYRDIYGHNLDRRPGEARRTERESSEREENWSERMIWEGLRNEE